MTVNKLIFRQLFEIESSTYTYILGCPETREAILIDPVIETVERDVKLLKELDLKLVGILDTHVHADHVTGSYKLRQEFSDVAKYYLSVHSGVGPECSDRLVLVKEGDKIPFGKRHVFVYETPGHTNGCLSYVLDDQSMVFTGDALLIRGCARTDFQQGSPEKLFASIKKLYAALPDDCLVYPAHDYRGHTASTIGEEKKYNLRIPEDQTLDKFAEIMENLNLARPKKIDVALPANLKCGNVERHEA